MNNIASVIVDVPTFPTDKPFDYLIPERWIGIIQQGMRVIVPFGNRQVLGFVQELKSESSFHELKEIIEPMELSPSLNDELLQLGDILTRDTLCFKIAAYQAMLPAALKAKYKKLVRKTSNLEDDSLSKEMKDLFHQQETVEWDRCIQILSPKTIYDAVQQGWLEITYDIRDKVNRKKVKFIQPAVSIDDLKKEEENLAKTAKNQKKIIQYFQNQFEPVELSTLLKELEVTRSSIQPLLNRGLFQIFDQEVYRDPYDNKKFKQTKHLPLTDEQQKVITPIHQAIFEERHEVFLLFGVTGSGKTEVYLQSIQKVLDQGKEAIVLVPEISLTPQMVQRFKGRFGNLVAVLHSGLSVGEKYDEWRKIQRKEVKVVVGARSAIFAPFENLGIIIIDEEHETSYKQEENPRYHARNIAIERGKFHHCPVVLGSATPSLESFARAKKGAYHLLTLSHRMNKQSLPSVEIVDMREELRNGNRTMFSTLLIEKMKDRLKKKEQIVLFLNKRGHSSFIMCRNCGLVANCPNCEISLTYHRVTEQLKCHYCGYEAIVPTKCPDCGSTHIRYFGTGTQKVEEQLQKLLPEARIIRMDVDTTSRKGAHEKLLAAFGEGKADILLGTQMIAKGLDFPNITLVGVLSADTMLHLPDFRSSEKTFQLLTQVSGRAGRHHLEGEVIIQTYTPNHYSIVLAGEQNYEQFYLKEMMLRKIGQYPPFYYLVLINIAHIDLLKVVNIAEKISRFLQNSLSKDSILLGPTASPIARINNRYRYQVLIKYKRESHLLETLRKIIHHYEIEKKDKNLSISIDLNPFSFM